MILLISLRFLGISIERLPDGRTKIHQRRYVEDMVQRFLPDGTATSKVPHITSVKLTKLMSPQTEEAKAEMSNVPYRSLIGALLHLANHTRPDIAAQVNICAQYSANPGEQHWRAALQILKYLKATPGYGVIYGPPKTDKVPYVPLVGYSDASWADDQDDRTSRSGIMVWSWGGPIEWRSTKQKSQALSSTEAEYYAACETAKSIIWSRRLYEEFGYTDLGIAETDNGIAAPMTEAEQSGAKPTIIFEDNSGCIDWSRNPVQHQRSKHIDIRYHYVRAKVKSGEIKLVYCNTDDQLADLLTKYLAAPDTPRFAYLRDMMVGDGVCDVHGG